MADTGNAATFTLSGFTVDIVSIAAGTRTLGTGDRSLLSHTGFMRKFLHDLTDAGSVTIEFEKDAADGSPTIGGAASSGVITYPTQAGESTPANITGTGWITSYTPPTFRNNELQMGSVTFTYDGETGPTETASS